MPSLTWVTWSGYQTLRGLAFEFHVVTDCKGQKPYYVIIADNLTHGLNKENKLQQKMCKDFKHMHRLINFQKQNNRSWVVGDAVIY
jgi:hypothetical protein